MKYLCGEVLFCTFFIMKGTATWSTVLPVKKEPCKESDFIAHISHLAVLYNNQLKDSGANSLGHHVILFRKTSLTTEWQGFNPSTHNIILIWESTIEVQFKQPCQWAPVPLSPHVGMWVPPVTFINNNAKISCYLHDLKWN
jgi:hypothetical protein